MAGPILPISDPNPSTRIPVSSRSRELSQSSHSSRPICSVPEPSGRDISASRGSLSSVRTQPPMMVPASGSKDDRDGNRDADMSIQVTQSGIAGKPAGGGTKYPGYPEYEEDEKTGYARFSNSSFDQTGKLWPQIRKMKVMTLRSIEGFGIFTDLSKSETQYKFELKPGSYLRFVKSTFMAQHRCLWAVCAQPKFADHTVDVAILDLDNVRQEAEPVQHIHDFELLKSTLRSHPSPSQTRFILVEDLSPAMIEALGSELDLDPEFFADHIAGAQDNYVHERSRALFLDDGNLNAHPTAFLEPKEYFSITWKRKALQGLQGQSTLRDVLVALNMKEGSTRSERLSQLFTTDMTYNSNIWRSHELIGTESPPGIAVAAEERVSIYFKKGNENEDVLTVVILFDPIRKHRTELEEGRFTLHDALSFVSFRMIHPTMSYHTFHKEKRTYLTGASVYSTRIDFLSYLCLALQSENSSHILSTTCPNNEFHLISVLLHFALTDWHGVFQSLNEVLDKIDSEISINAVLQECINGWRHILGAWRKQLINDKARIDATIQIIEDFDINECTCDSVTGSKRKYCQRKDIVALKTSYGELLTCLMSLIERIERSFAAIMSSMSILESQRAISQAASVNRLTELAFIFIPLSFGNSIFGMQIPAWSANYTPSLWFAISGGLIGGAYMLRIIVRARLVSAIGEHISLSIRRYGNIEDNGPVPTLTFFGWVVSKLGLAALGLGAVAAGIACVWKYVGSYGGKVAATVVLGFVGLLWCLGLYLWRSWEVSFRDYAYLKEKPQLGSKGLPEKVKGRWLSRTTEAKLRVWRNRSWKDIFYPEGRTSTVRTQPMM
ncbi:hypothetical protein BGX38DRAFT_1227080 [Terfezia claveryi]|nr:hypothetical protein BGX38DRAFT_1227080 [Terfezia claveryi]